MNKRLGLAVATAGIFSMISAGCATGDVKVDSAKEATRTPSASFYSAPKCYDMGELIKSTTEAISKTSKLVEASDKPAFVASRFAYGTHDQWTVYLSDGTCVYTYAVFTDAGTCDVKNVPFELGQDCHN